MAKGKNDKRTNKDPQHTIQKTKDPEERTPLEPGNELM